MGAYNIKWSTPNTDKCSEGEGFLMAARGTKLFILNLLCYTIYYFAFAKRFTAYVTGLFVYSGSGI